MKKILIVLGSSIFILVVIIIVNPPEITFEESKVISPVKPKSVPNNPFWVGVNLPQFDAHSLKGALCHQERKNGKTKKTRI